jgi:osmotically-inducible protein OsmY
MKSPSDTEQILADFAITSQILGALKTNPQIPVNVVDVVTRNGCVTLSGNLHWEFQIGIVKSLVEKMAGVKELNNRIAVNPAAANSFFWSFSAN